MQRWRIYCLTPHPDSLLMWAHYGAKHNGICLVFDASRPYIGGAFEVMYQQNRPVIDCRTLANSTEIAEKMVLVKSTHWAYEHEYRILGRAGEFDPEPTQSIPKTAGDFFALPAGALTGIIAGCKADLDLIRRIVCDSHSAVNLYRAVQSEHAYSVSIVPEGV